MSQPVVAALVVVDLAVDLEVALVSPLEQAPAPDELAGAIDIGYRDRYWRDT